MNNRSLVCFFCMCFFLVFNQKGIAQVLEYDTKITISENGMKQTEKRVLIQINDKSENWLSQVEISHSPRQKLSFDYAHIIDSSKKKVRKLKKKEIETRSKLSRGTYYQDEQVSEFELYWNEYPYQIEYAYTIKEESYLNVAWWTPLLYTGVGTIKGTLQIDLPNNLKLKVKQSESIDHAKTNYKDKQIWSWKSSSPRIFQDEINMPPLYQLIPSVQVVLEDFDYGVKGSTDTWASFGNWFEELNTGLEQLTNQEIKTLESVVEGLTETDEIVKALYYYLQDHTVYVNVAIEFGGHKSYPASYVCDNKYGDCKALTTYMKAILNHFGIQSHYVIINAGKNKVFFEEDFPSSQFNHVILAVPQEKDTIWLENTASYLPYNYLGTFTQGRYGLVVNNKMSQLNPTPKLDSKNVLTERIYKINSIAKDSINLAISLKLRGELFENFRYYIFNNDKSSQQKMVNRIIGSYDLEDLEWKVKEYHRDSTSLNIEVNGSSEKLIRKIGSMLIIDPLVIQLPNFEEPTKRRHDVVIPYPICKSDLSILDMKHYASKEINIPQDIEIESPFGSYVVKFVKEDDQLKVSEFFELNDQIIKKENYGPFFEFIDSIYSYKKQSKLVIR